SSRLVSTSRTTSRQSTSADTRPVSRSATVSSAVKGDDHGGDKSIDLIVAHADDVEAAAVGHVDRLVLAKFDHLVLRQREHRKHPTLATDKLEAPVGRGNALAHRAHAIAPRRSPDHA